MFRLAPAFIAIGVGCATTQRERTPRETEAPDPPRLLSFEGAEPQPPPGPEWRAGMQGDPLDLARLGRQEGAARLMELSRSGGATGALALRALSLSPDARAERGRACQLLSQVRLQERHFVLSVVHELLTNAPPMYEELAPGADGVCQRELAAVRDDARASAAERDLAESGLFNISQ